MGCYSCTIKIETNFYQPKPGYHGGMPGHIDDFTEKNTNKILSAPSYPRDIFLARDVSGPALKGLDHLIHLFNRGLT